MRIFGQTSPKEIKITMGIWLILMVAAIVTLAIIRLKTGTILENIYFLKVPNNAKVQVLYEQASAEAQKVFTLAEQLNKDSAERKTVPADNSDLQAAMKNYQLAFKLDASGEFDNTRTGPYETISQLMDASGNRIEQLNYAARAFISLGDYENAKDYINDIITSNPSHLETTILSAQLMLLENQTTEATKLLADYNSSNTLNAKGRWVLSRGLMLSGDLPQAIENLQAAVAEEKDNVRFRIELSKVEDQAGDTAGAIKTLMEGINLGGDQDAVFLHVLGELYLKTNQPALAIPHLERADKLAPFSGDVQLSLARAYKNAGKIRQADSVLRRAIQINPELRDKLL